MLMTGSQSSWEMEKTSIILAYTDEICILFIYIAKILYLYTLYQLNYLAWSKAEVSAIEANQ